MKTVMQLDEKQIEKMDLTISITMSVNEWRELMRQIDTRNYPSWQFGNAISTAIGNMNNATRRVYEEQS